MGGKTQKVDLTDVAIELKMQSKMMMKQAEKQAAEEKQMRKKCLDYMNKGDPDSAKMFAEGAIKAKKESLNVRRFGVKMAALSQKVESAARTQQMSETMKNTMPLMQKAMKQMEKSGIANSVTDFEKIFEDMEVKTGEMDAALDNIYSTSIDQTEVSQLMQQVQEEAGMAAQ